MIMTAQDSITAKKNLDSLKTTLSQIASDSFISQERIREAMIFGWSKAVDKFLEDDVLQQEEEESLIEFSTQFDLKQDDLNEQGAYTKVVKAVVIRDILNGNIVERVKPNKSLPFNFQKDEKLVWVFQGVNYLEDKTKRSYVGGYQGVSVRVAKGLYFRTGGFKGAPVEHTERVHADDGLMAVTNKHVYFAGSRKSFRIAYSKIVSFEPFSDGIGIMRDAATAKPQIFVTEDGWFTYNLLSNLASL
jgi:hypothetical protein